MNDVERLKKACNAVKDDPKWQQNILDLLEYVTNASPDERRSEDFHRRIWSDQSISSAGQGENINVEPAISDMGFRQWLANMSLSSLPDNRHSALEEIRRDLVDRVMQLGVSKRPWAKGTRLLAALFPRDFTTLVADGTLNDFIKDFNKAFPNLKISQQGSVSYKHRQILDKLDEALGPVPDDNLKELIRRMTLPYSLSLSIDGSDEMTDPQNSLSLFIDESDKIAPQNIILYGPPGTGKTYSTTERALELILGKNEIKKLELDPNKIKSRFRDYQKEGQIEFVTFHQSYGYEEFVEGLRPVLDDTEGGDVHYKLHDGVFKRIALQAAAEGQFDGLWGRLVAKIRADKDRTFKSKGKGKQVGKKYVLNVSKQNNIKARRCEIEGKNNGPFGRSYTASKENSQKLWDKRSTFEENPEHLTNDKAKKILNVLGNDFPALWIVYKRLWKLSLCPSSKHYVLIIDEINRGNMSKILGELITLLEPDKRLGEDNELILKLPYSQKDFGVPPNLHILGTMNTADRSIALMDVALRRRFKFEELMPDEEVLRKELKGKLQDDPLVDLVVDLFNTLNKRIRFLYDRDHQLGHAYFLNVNSLEDLRLVFVDRVIPLLQEYFYGTGTRSALSSVVRTVRMGN